MEKLQTFCREYKIKGVQYYENLSATNTVIKRSSHRRSSAYFDTKGNLVQLAIENTKLDKVTLAGFKKLNTLIFKKCSLTRLTLTNLPAMTGLWISDNKSLERLDIGNLGKIEILSLTNCGIKELHSLKLPPSIITLPWLKRK